MIMKIKICLLAGIALVNAANAIGSDFTNIVYITTNISFSLHNPHVSGAQSEFKSNEEIIWGLVGTSTNSVWYRHFPSGNFDFHLFDNQGQEISKTKKGVSFTTEPPLPTYENLLSKKFFGYAVDNAQGEFRQLFRPDEMFAITNKGTYDLEVRMRLCVIMTNNVPDLNAMLDARNVTGGGLPYVTNFGVLTSPPLRVKIIKE
jgi:hypothetical protein